MTDKIKIDVEGSEEGVKKLGNVADAVEGVNSKLDDNKEANDGAGKATSSFTEKAAKLAIGLAALKAIMVDTLKAYAEQDALNGQLQRSLRKTSDSVADAAKSFKEAQNTFTNNVKFGVGIAAQTAAYRKLVDSTGNAKQSLNDLKLAVDIQAQSDVDLTSATDKLMKARQGDTGALKELGVLTKDQEANLASITDETLRAELAVQFLTEAYSGAAKENAGLADELASTEVQVERLKVATGSLVETLWTGSNSLVDGVLEVVGVLPKGNTTLNAFTGGMEEFAKQTKEAVSEVDSFLTTVTTGDFLSVAKELAQGGLFAGGFAALKKVAEVRSRSDDEAARAAQKRKFTIGEIADVEDMSAKDKVDLEKRREKSLDRQLKTTKTIKKEIENTSVFETGGFGEEEDAQKKEAEAQRKIDLEIRLAEIQNQRLTTNDERLRAELDLETQLLNIKYQSLDPELERLKISEANLKLGLRVKSLNEEKRLKVETKRLEDKAEAEATVGTAIELSAQGLAGAADLFDAGERTKAGISGAMETARAIAAGAAGNIPGAIGHGLAAAQFVAIAAGAGSSSAGASTGSASLASEGSSFSGSASEELAIAGEPEERRNSSLQIVNNFNSTFPPSPEQEREARDATVRDARRQV